MSEPHADAHGEHGFSHPMSPAVLIGVFVALIVLTIATVAAVDNPLIPEGFEVMIALTIATVKAALVVLFFMHMIHDKGLNAMFFVFSLVFVAIFLGFALTDTEQYQHRIQEYETVYPEETM